MNAGLWQTTVAATALTHRDEAAVAASVGFVGLLLETSRAGRPGASRGRSWWPRTFLTYARALETGVQYGCRVPNDGFRGTLCDRVEQTVLPALAAGVTRGQGRRRLVLGRLPARDGAVRAAGPRSVTRAMPKRRSCGR